MKEIDSHIIKLTGRAELPEALVMDNNYQVVLRGAVSNITLSDNENGTMNAIYSFKPVLVEGIDSEGKKVVAKDTRSKSQLLRSRIWKLWKDEMPQEEFDAYYEKVMTDLIINIERYAQK